MDDKFIKKLLRDLAVELHDEFDRNFERKAFFNTPWTPTKTDKKGGSLMARTNQLRRGNRAQVVGDRIEFTNHRPDAAIHNEGGTIVITAAMKRFFWAMYYQAAGAVAQKKDGTDRKTKKNEAIKQEAENWRALALKKVGDKLVIPQRQFVGYHPDLDKVVEDAIEQNISIVFDDITKKLNSSR